MLLPLVLSLLAGICVKRALVGPQKLFARTALGLEALAVFLFVQSLELDDGYDILGNIATLLGIAVAFTMLSVEFNYRIRMTRPRK
jgi:hypothetical protein